MGGKYSGGIGKQGYQEDMLEQLERSSSPPLSRTLRQIKNPGEEDIVHLSVGALYWGVRTMIFRLTDDDSMMKKADGYLKKKLNRWGLGHDCRQALATPQWERMWRR